MLRKDKQKYLTTSYSPFEPSLPSRIHYISKSYILYWPHSSGFSLLAPSIPSTLSLASRSSSNWTKPGDRKGREGNEESFVAARGSEEGKSRGQHKREGKAWSGLARKVIAARRWGEMKRKRRRCKGKGEDLMEEKGSEVGGEKKIINNIARPSSSSSSHNHIPRKGICQDKQGDQQRSLHLSLSYMNAHAPYRIRFSCRGTRSDQTDETTPQDPSHVLAIGCVNKKKDTLDKDII